MATIEITTFKLAGADEKAFLQADYRVQTEFVPNLHGFMRRTTARGVDGDWIVLTLWGSTAEAEAAEELAEEHEATQAFASFVDQATVRRARYTTLD